MLLLLLLIFEKQQGIVGEAGGEKEKYYNVCQSKSVYLVTTSFACY